MISQLINGIAAAAALHLIRSNKASFAGLRQLTIAALFASKTDHASIV